MRAASRRRRAAFGKNAMAVKIASSKLHMALRPTASTVDAGIALIGIYGNKFFNIAG